MRFDKSILTLKEFAAEAGYHPFTVIRYIFKKGKCIYQQNGRRGQYRVTREEADRYHSLHTYGGQAYGKKQS